MTGGPGADVEDDPLSMYAVFFRREFRAVVHTVYLILPDRGHAEELAQEAFIQLFRNWRKVSSYDRPGAWVRRVAIRLANREAKRQRVRPLLERATAGGTVAAPDPPVDEDRVAVVRALATLSPPQRAAIVLFYFEDLPVEEIAEILECSQNTVKSHLYRGRAALRTILGEDEEEVRDGA